jgi:hypothetical protein
VDAKDEQTVRTRTATRKTSLDLADARGYLYLSASQKAELSRPFKAHACAYAIEPPTAAARVLVAGIFSGEKQQPFKKNKKS